MGVSKALFVLAALLIVHVYSQCSSRPKVSSSECCPTALSYLNSDIATNCGYKKGKKTVCDTAKCIMSQNGVLHSNGTVNRDALPQFLLRSYPSGWSTAISSVLQICNARVRVSTKSCEQLSFIRCINKNIRKSCPDTMWAFTDKCNQLKTYWSQCGKGGKVKKG